MARKDYYQILGITNEEKNLPWAEFEKILKRKYRKLSLEWHPDRQGGKSESEKQKAEEKFKDIAEAYDTLSDKSKKEKYDLGDRGGFRFEGGSPFGPGFDPFNFDPFEMFGGRRASKKEKQANVGSSIRISIPLTLEEIFGGTAKNVRYKRQEPCSECHGSGLGHNGTVETCSHCGGTGMIFRSQGNMQTMTSCPYCNGKGKTIKNPCSKCNGSGLNVVDHEVTFEIPKGVVGGMEVKIQGEGCLTTDPNGIPGDLIVRIEEAPHDKFVRRGNDLLFEINVPIITALMGGEINIQTIDNKTLMTKINVGTEDGKNIRFTNQGLPIYGNENARGHLIGVIKLELPKELNDEEKRILNELKEQEHFKNG